jgi:hypothetical protein
MPRCVHARARSSLAVADARGRTKSQSESPQACSLSLMCGLLSSLRACRLRMCAMLSNVLTSSRRGARAPSGGWLDSSRQRLMSFNIFVLNPLITLSLCLLVKVAQTPGAQKLVSARQSRPHSAFDEDQRSTAQLTSFFKITQKLDDGNRGSGAGTPGSCKCEGVSFRVDAKRLHLRLVRGWRRVQLEAIR